jgi:3'-5' exoribonuclease
MMNVKEFKEGKTIQASLLLTSVSKGLTNAGQPYLSLILQDKTGSIEAKYWDVQPAIEQLVEAGQFYAVTADVIAYRSSLQLKIERLQKLNPDTITLSDFTMSAPVPLNALEDKLARTIQSIQDGDYQRLVSTLIQTYYERFIVYPAAVRNHHEYTSGLLYHTLSMIDIAEFFIQQYPPLDRDLVISGILLHDLGKTVEFSSPIVAKYTTEGKLIGHIQWMSAEIHAVGEKLSIPREKVMYLQHIVLSHHGKPEFGSAVPPLMKEALLVHMVDDFDAKMTMIDKALSAIEPDSFTPRLFTFDDRSFYKKK